MAYVKQTFVDNVTPLDAEHFNHMEEGIYTLDNEKLAKSELEAAIETALADAAESGEFKGDPGADGKTPVKGSDYYTEADKAEMTEAVKTALSAESWTFTLTDGSSVTKSVVIK